MANMASMITRVRQELGDFGHPFRDTFRGTGDQVQYSLSGTNISTTAGFTASWVHDNQVVLLVQGDAADYAVEAEEGIIHLLSASVSPLPDGDTLVVTGTSNGMFSDLELMGYIQDAVLQHSHDATTEVRYRDENGFIELDVEPVTLFSLPEIEELPVALLATIEAMWALATDAASDIDVSTADGTSVPRSQRFQQIRGQIDALTEKYTWICQQLNVGIARIEMFTLRRVSRLNNRLVPVFVEREYDDWRYPDRILPPINARDRDNSGVLSPTMGGGWW